ncbi:unnamed protein product, partial [Symbiodinium pilosum]
STSEGQDAHATSASSKEGSGESCSEGGKSSQGTTGQNAPRAFDSTAEIPILQRDENRQGTAGEGGRHSQRDQ